MIEDLKSKKMGELREIAAKMGLEGVRAESKEALITRLTFALQPGLLDEINKNGVEHKPVAKPKQDAVWLTTEQVMKILTPYKDKIKLAFYDEYGQPATENAKTWHVKNGPAEDSGSMSISPKWLEIKVAEIANARFPARYSRTGTELDGCLSV